MPDFTSEDDLNTFEGWLKYQGYNVADFSPDELRMWRETYDEVTKASAAVPKVGLMKLPPLVAGEPCGGDAGRSIRIS